MVAHFIVCIFCGSLSLCFEKRKWLKPLSRRTDWQALLLLSAIFKHHSRTELLDSGWLKWLCLTISHCSTSPFFSSLSFYQRLVDDCRSMIFAHYALAKQLDMCSLFSCFFLLLLYVCRFLFCPFSFSYFLVLILCPLVLSPFPLYSKCKKRVAFVSATGCKSTKYTA